MLGTLRRGDFVKLAYRLGQKRATAELTIQEPGGAEPHRVVVQRGYVTAVERPDGYARLGDLLTKSGALSAGDLLRALALPGPCGQQLLRLGFLSPAMVEDALRRQLNVRLTALASVDVGDFHLKTTSTAVAIEPAPSPRDRKAITHALALDLWARRHIERGLDTQRALALEQKLRGIRLVLKKNELPALSTLDLTDQRIVAALSQPVRCDELPAKAEAPKSRVIAFVHFLRAVGAVELVKPAGQVKHLAVKSALTERPRSWAHETLGVEADCSMETVRQVYLHLAWQLHPDRNPHVAVEARNELSVRFARVNSAYQHLVAADSGRNPSAQKRDVQDVKKAPTVRPSAPDLRKRTC